MRKIAFVAAVAAAVTSFAAHAETSVDALRNMKTSTQTERSAKLAKKPSAKIMMQSAERGLVFGTAPKKQAAKQQENRASAKPFSATQAGRNWSERGAPPADFGIDRTKTSSVASAAAATPAKAAKKSNAPVAKSSGKRPYGAIIARYAAAYGVPVSLAHAVVRVESNYRANARGSAGEIGLMQIKPATARGLGYSGSAKGLYNPETNIKYGMKYLGQAHKLSGGSTCGTILKYNAGHGAKRMNPVSARYCAKVRRHLGA